MDNYSQALQQYMASKGSLARNALAGQESLLAGRADLIQGREGMMESKAASGFARKLQEIGLKGQTGEAVGGIGGVLIPKALKGGQRLAKMAQGAVDSRWKTAQADRFSESERPSAGRTVEPEGGDIEMQPATSFKDAPKMGDLPEGGGDVEEGAEAGFKPSTIPEEDIPKLTGGDKGLASDEAGIEGEVGDLAPELTSISSGLGALGGVLGSLAGAAGIGLGGYAIYEAIHSAVEAGKAGAEDPYAGIRGKIQSYGKQIGSLESKASADQFLEKVGSGAPSFGSMAVPTFDTSKMVGGGSHF